MFCGIPGYCHALIFQLTLHTLVMANPVANDGLLKFDGIVTTPAPRCKRNIETATIVAEIKYIICNMDS